MQHLYSYGLPFQPDLANNLDQQITRVRNRFASLIIVDGGLGQGKTTLAIECGDYINGKFGLGPIALDGPQLAMGGVDFLKKIRICFEQKLPCIIYDEAGDFSKRGSLSNFNAMLNRTFETFRAFECIVIIILPFFGVLDNDIFDKNIPRFLLHLSNRDSRQGNYALYSLDKIHWLRHYMKKYTVNKTFPYKIVGPNIRGHFLDLDSDRSKMLDNVSTKNKLVVLRKSEVKIEGLMTYPELATKLLKSIDWVRRAVSNLKIQPNRVIERVKYFDQNALNQLSEHSDYTGDTRRNGVEE